MEALLFDILFITLPALSLVNMLVMFVFSIASILHYRDPVTLLQVMMINVMFVLSVIPLNLLFTFRLVLTTLEGVCTLSIFHGLILAISAYALSEYDITYSYLLSIIFAALAISFPIVSIFLEKLSILALVRAGFLASTGCVLLAYIIAKGLKWKSRKVEKKVTATLATAELAITPPLFIASLLPITPVLFTPEITAIIAWLSIICLSSLSITSLVIVKKGRLILCLEKKHRRFIFVTLIIFFIFSLSILSCTFVLSFQNLMILDIDKRENGNYVMVGSYFNEEIKHVFNIDAKVTSDTVFDQSKHFAREVTPEGDVVWEMSGFAIAHEIVELKSGNFMVVDTFNERLVEIDPYSQIEVWEWYPSSFDWSKINSKWDEDHYYNNPTNYDWSHINHFELDEREGREYCLVSLRNFDLVIEMDFTSQRVANDESNVVWYFGDLGNYDLLNHQHNPDYMENGNILVADSGNSRVIEVDKNTKEIDWEYNETLEWNRDIDEIDEDRFLITDHDEVFIYNRESQVREWEYGYGMWLNYEADYLDNDNILIAFDDAGKAIEITKEYEITWEIGRDIITDIFNSVFLVILSSILLFFIFTFFCLSKNKKMRYEKKKKLILIVLLICFASFLTMLLFYIYRFDFVGYIVIYFQSVLDVN